MRGEPPPLLSRVADSVYWMARYIERAENVARFIDVNLNLQLDLPLAPSQPVAAAHRYHRRPPRSSRSATAWPTQDNVIEFLAFDRRTRTRSCPACAAARENARSVREMISSEMWEQINSIYLQIQTQRRAGARAHCSTRSAARSAWAATCSRASPTPRCRHNEAWHFLRLGRLLERADKTSRILDVKYFMLLPSLRDVGTPYDDIQWSAVLKSVSGFEMYRKNYGRIAPPDVVEFLVLDREFPRAMRFCIKSANESLQSVTGTPIGAFRYRSEQLHGPAARRARFHLGG